MADNAARIAQLGEAIQTNRGYLAKTGGLAYADKIAAYSKEKAALEAAAEANEWSGTWDEAYSRWLDAADEVLKAAGKPYGRDGAERGSMDRAESVALAKSIGVFDELGGDDGIFGPPAGPGTSA